MMMGMTYLALATASPITHAELGANCTLLPAGTGIGSGSLGTESVTSAESCCAACLREQRCVAFTFEPPSKCYLKGNLAAGKCSSPTCVSGTNGRKPTPEPPPSPHHPPHHPPSPPSPPPPPPPRAQQLKDLATLRSRFFDFYLSFGDCTQTQFCMQGSYMLLQDGSKGTCAVTCADSEKFAVSMSANGTWADVNYTDETHAVWKPMLHPDRVLSMVRSYHCGECKSGFKSAALLAKIHTALGWWLDTKLKPSQWWWGDIGQPDVVGAIMMLLGPDATSQELTQANAMLEGKGIPKGGTGENVVWELQVAINRAALSNDTASAWAAFSAMWRGVTLAPGGEGVQPDGSFHFHGDILYSGGYGADYAINLAVFANITAGTSYQIPAPAMEILSMYLLEGQQHMVHAAADAHGNGTYYDVSTKGREISRPPHGNLLFPAAVMASSIRGFPHTNRTPELLAFADRIAPASASPPAALSTQDSGGTTASRGAWGRGAKPFIGARHFWQSDYTAYHAASFFMSLKMMSTRMANNEICNNEVSWPRPEW